MASVRRRKREQERNKPRTTYLGYSHILGRVRYP